jgi:hypothetical protein
MAYSSNLTNFMELSPSWEVASCEATQEHPNILRNSKVYYRVYMGTGGSFPGVKRPGREADHSPTTSAEVKKMWIYTSTPPYAFMV